MAFRPEFFPVIVILLTLGSFSNALVSTAPKLISDLKETIAKGLGFEAEEFKVSGFDVRDSLVGQSIAYEFHLQVENQTLPPFKLLEEVNRWDVALLQSTQNDNPDESDYNNKNRNVLPPFQLAGPMELWIQDAKDMRVSLPHDVDAGVLKKVILADGAVVTVKGARSVTLRNPLDLPLPFHHTNSDFASGLVTIAERLRLAASRRGSATGETPLLSLRIVGPTSLSTSSSPSSTTNRLKLKRLAPGLVELSSTAVMEEEQGASLLASDEFAKMWPFASVNGSNSNLRGFEALLYSVLGEKAHNKGSFKLLKAEASAQTFVKMVFGLEKELKEGDGVVDWQGIPEWKTKPQSLKMHFEVLAKLDGDKVVPEKVMQVPDPVLTQDTLTPNLLMGNVTMSSIPLFYTPPTFFSL